MEDFKIEEIQDFKDDLETFLNDLKDIIIQRRIHNPSVNKISEIRFGFEFNLDFEDGFYFPKKVEINYLGCCPRKKD